MEDRRLLLRGPLIAIMASGLMLGGCAQIDGTNEGHWTDSGIYAAPPVETPNDEELPPFDLTHYPYPDGANYPPEGYQFVPLAGGILDRAVDDPYNDEWETAHIIKSQGGELWMSDCETGIVIEPWGLPNSSWIAITRPAADEPWVEFEPHGLVFNSSQYAQISYDKYGLPGGVNPEDLTVWYWNEELEAYELIGGVVNLEEAYMAFDIEHFSRYIVACQL